MTGQGRPDGRGLEPGDNELLALVQRGSVAAFAELYDRYCARAYRVARIVSVDRARAEEAVQEAFGTIWRARDTYRPDRPTAAAWVLTIVRNRAIDATRRDAAYQASRASDALLEHHASPEDVAADAVDRAAAGDLRRLLTRLPDAQREVIVLAFYGELSQTEIAAELDVPLGTIKARMRRGLNSLREDLQQNAA
ncbi:MAG TPA: sigma-70 family RNA polymerase sigma factor [Solirubrobacteraceae bacterium]|jgi:RNA polymerase sigma-70 factor (ECF subfamily)|nr:sigma-70 family RNA polymerase sigma factor [Solirubrobacteraceae bacterium]